MMRRRTVFSADLAEWCADRAGESYRPSNGSEGELFERAWCADCRRQGTGESPIRCPVLAAAHAFQTFEDGYPRQLVYGRDGQPLCTAFVDRCGRRQGYRCKHTLDLFPDRYCNHQLTLI